MMIRPGRRVSFKLTRRHTHVLSSSPPSPSQVCRCALYNNAGDGLYVAGRSTTRTGTPGLRLISRGYHQRRIVQVLGDPGPHRDPQHYPPPLHPHFHAGPASPPSRSTNAGPGPPATRSRTRRSVPPGAAIGLRLGLEDHRANDRGCASPCHGVVGA